MAKIVATYDTVSKKLDINHGGESLANVKEASFYHMGKDKDGNDMHDMRVQMHQKDEENSMQHVHTMYAKKCVDNKVQDKVVEYLNKLLAPKGK